MNHENIAAIRQTIGGALRAAQLTPTPSGAWKESSSSASVNKPDHNDQISIETNRSRQTLDTMQRLEKLTDGLHTAIKNIRKTNNGLGHAANAMDQMTANLGKIIKNNPPYSLEDQERKELLMSYISLRRQIETLTVPTPPAPIYEKIEHMWQDLFPKNDGRIATPELTATSSDAEVSSASISLWSTAKNVSSLISTIGSSL